MAPKARRRLETVSSLQIRLVGLDAEPPRRTDYLDAWDLQRQVHAEVADGRSPDTLLLLEHPSVYTAGRRTEPHERPQDGTPVIDVDRGGKITWHGPGQLVGYPIVTLPEAIGVVDYVRRVEEALIRSCAEFDLATGRVDGRSGVWLAAAPGRPERKIAAIGIRVSRGVTMHGFSFNIDPDLHFYDRFVPCGISDAGVTSLAEELGTAPELRQVLAVVSAQLGDLLRFEPYQPSPDLERTGAASGEVRYGLQAPAR